MLNHSIYFTTVTVILLQLQNKYELMKIYCYFCSINKNGCSIYEINHEYLQNYHSRCYFVIDVSVLWQSSHTINNSRSLWTFFWFITIAENAPLPVTDGARANFTLHYDLDTVSWNESKSLIRFHISVTIAWKTISSSESIVLTVDQCRKICRFILPFLRIFVIFKLSQWEVNQSRFS